MRKRHPSGRAVSYEASIKALDELDLRFHTSDVARFRSHLRVTADHNLEALRRVIAADPMNTRFPPPPATTTKP